MSVEIGGREVASEKVIVKDLLIVGMGDSFASGEGNPDVPVRFSRDRTADYGKRSADSDLTGYPARIGPWKQIGDKAFIQENARWTDQGCHRSLYSHQLRAALQLGLEDDTSRRHLCRRRLLGIGSDVRPVPAVRGQRVGAEPQRHVADFRHRFGAVR